VSARTEEEPTQKIVAGDGTGMNLRGSPGCHLVLYSGKRLRVDDGRPGLLHPHWRITAVNGRMAGSASPDQGAAVGLVVEDLMDSGLSPAVSVQSAETF